MATANELPSYFLNRAAAGHPVVLDLPKFDLDGYIANYSGRTRLDRLLHIGRTSPVLAVDALKAAVKEAKRGKDVRLYHEIAQTLRMIAPDDPDAAPDTEWTQRTEKQVKVETDRLEAELKGYKNNLIKESIRMGNEDLGLHYQAIGDFGQAGKAFGRMRDYCTSAKHISEMCLKLILVSIEQCNWMAVQSNTLKMRNLQLREEDEQETQAKASAAAGLAQLASGNYGEAAVQFLQTTPSLGSSFNQVLSANDVAVYGGLCALASMERQELQKQVLQNSGFRTYLELEPHMRRAVAAFCSSKYSHCLALLEAYKTDYLLDLRLQRHVEKLYAAVRSKSIVQYFIPFSGVTLTAMAHAFASDEASVEAELVEMIEQGKLDARVDTQHRLLVARRTNLRHKVHADAISMAKGYERMARLRLMRMSIANAGLEVKSAAAQASTATEQTGSSQGGPAASGRSVVGRM